MPTVPEIPSYKPVPKEELPFRETLLEEAELDECDRLDLQFLGSLQGDTAHVFFVSYPDFGVIAVDAKIKDLPFLEEVYDNDPIVGGSLQTYLPASIYNKVFKAIEDMQMRSLIREFVFAWDNETFYSLTISTNSINEYSTIGIEIEILDEMDLLDIASEKSTLDGALKDIGRALDLCVDGREAAMVACDAIFKMVDKYDRGMVYYFHDDLSGEVIHEIKKPHIESSYYGMHFPSADIPQSARLLFRKNVVRYVKNVDGEDVPILSNQKAPIDLSQTRSRCAHKCHLIYCKGIGITNCLNLALVNGNDLWGLISFHGYTERSKPSLHQLIACESIAACVSARIMSKAKATESTRMILMGHIFRNWDANKNIIDNVEALGDQIIKVMEADVFAARYRNENVVWSVAKGDMNLLPRGLFWEKMSKQVPNYGLCVKSTKKSLEELDLTEVNCPGSDFVFIRDDEVEILIGRAFRERDVVWAGNPDAPKINIGGLLHPRASFEAQLEKARKDSHPFDTLDQKLAELLRDLIFRKESNVWALGLLDKCDIKMDIFRSFDSLEDGQETGGDALLGELSHYLKSLNNVKPKRMHLEAPKIENKVGLAEFATQSVAAVVGSLDENQKKRFKVSIDCPNRDSILVQHTHMSQIVANVAQISVDLAGSRGQTDVQFQIQKFSSAMKTIEADAANHKGFVFVMKDVPMLNSVEAIMVSKASENQRMFFMTIKVFGGGVEPDQLNKMFQSYKEADFETASNIEESIRMRALISAHLCRELGGFMACSSTPYDGTVVHVGIPVDVVDEEKAHAPPVARDSPILVSGPILVVGENSAEIATFIQRETKRSGLDIQVFQSRGGCEAVSAYCRKVTPNVMIVDNQLHDTDGLETIAKVRKIEYDRNLQPSYVVSLTDDVTDYISMLLLGAGSQEVMLKPLPEDSIPNLVRRFQVESGSKTGLVTQAMQFM